ncbi:hypothetical protein BaRGS_00035136 [Batillaria attramentaria]|uniref:Uncharacterized protein n=1 Tax=Batillaria attramentaria TaxID=370345 RepID=A0ABD0JEW4_9CAEN
MLPRREGGAKEKQRQQMESKTKKDVQKEFDRALLIEVAAINPFHLGNMKKGSGSGIDEDFTEEDKLLMDIMQMKVAAEEEKMTVNKGAEQEKETKERKSGKKPWQAG